LKKKRGKRKDTPSKKRASDNRTIPFLLRMLDGRGRKRRERKFHIRTSAGRAK